MLGAVDAVDHDGRARLIAAAPPGGADEAGLLALDLTHAASIEPLAVTALQQYLAGTQQALVVVGAHGMFARRLRATTPALPRYRTLADATAAVTSGVLQPRWLSQRVPGGGRLGVSVRGLTEDACLRWGLDMFVGPALRAADWLVSRMWAMRAAAVEIVVSSAPGRFTLAVRAVSPRQSGRPPAAPYGQYGRSVPAFAARANVRGFVRRTGGARRARVTLSLPDVARHRTTPRTVRRRRPGAAAARA